MDVIKYLINKTKRVLPFTVAKAVITDQATTVQEELDSLRNDIQYYVEFYDPEYLERCASASRYARDQGIFANEQGTYILNNKESIQQSINNSTYAKEQGDYAKLQGLYAQGEGDYIHSNHDNINEAVANSAYAKEQGDYAKTQGDYIKGNKSAINDSIDNSSNALLYASYAKGYKNYIDTVCRRNLCGSRFFNIPQPTIQDDTIQPTTM